MNLPHLFNISDGTLIAIVGGDGKSSWMFAIMVGINAINKYMKVHDE